MRANPVSAINKDRVALLQVPVFRIGTVPDCRVFLSSIFPVLLIIVNKDEYNRHGCHCCLCQCGIVPTVNLSSLRASPPFGQYQIRLLDKGGDYNYDSTPI